MKGKVIESGNIDQDYDKYANGTEEEGVDNDFHESPPKRNLEGKGKIKWYEMIDYKKIIPLLPVLRNIRGSKTKINLWMFSEIDNACQSMFERNKSFFRFRAQVDIFCFYLGSKMMEQIFLLNNGFPKSKLSLMLEACEKEYLIYDEMKILKEKFKTDLEKFWEGYISDEEIYAKQAQYVQVLSEAQNQRKMAKIFDDMIGQENNTRIKDRLRKRSERKQSDIHVVEK
jgi:hypothetical protein